MAAPLERQRIEFLIARVLFGRFLFRRGHLVSDM